MVIRGRVPPHVGLGGGGTDMVLFCEEQGGAIIGSTINKYAYCPIVPREDDQITVDSIDFDMTVKYNTDENYVYNGKLDLVTVVLKVMDIKQGCKVFLQRDTPPDSGLGTPSTVMVAILMAMPRWRGTMMDAYAMVDLIYQVERLDLGIDGGYQDQYAASFGGFSFIELHGHNNMVVNPLRIKKDTIHEPQYNLLFCHTGKIHISTNIIKDQVQNYKKKDSFQATYEVKVLAYTLEDELLKGNLHNFGKLLDYGWQSKKRTSSKITTPQIDEFHDEALKAGALGGKLLGAGGGGYPLMYCPYSMRHKVVARVEQVGGQLADWNFGPRGAQNWVMDGDRWQYDQVTVHMPDRECRFDL